LICIFICTPICTKKILFLQKVGVTIWQDYCDAMIRRRGLVPAIDPEKAKGSTSLKNR
jgi:hypothetical protein